jgi:hypothetical protein
LPLQKDGFSVEFESIIDENGKLKAQNVTASDGTPCPGPEPRERRRRRKKNEGSSAESAEETGGETGGEKSDDGGEDKDKKEKSRRRRKNGKKPEDGNTKPPAKSWYDDLDESVQKSLESRSIKVDSGRVFITVGGARIKLGTGGYTALAHANGIIAEGTYTHDEAGKVAATWNSVLKYDGTEWKASAVDEESDALVTEISLADGKCRPTTLGGFVIFCTFDV